MNSDKQLFWAIGSLPQHFWKKILQLAHHTKGSIGIKSVNSFDNFHQNWNKEKHLNKHSQDHQLVDVKCKGGVFFCRTSGANTRQPQSQFIQQLNTSITSSTVPFWVHFENADQTLRVSCGFAFACQCQEIKRPMAKWVPPHPSTPPSCSCAFPLRRPQLPDRAQSLPFGLPAHR